jgi:hypothetical protein
MERIDRRAPIKVIAQELGVSETRINQHIRALKDIYEAENLADLVACFRKDTKQSQPNVPAEELATPEHSSPARPSSDFSEPAYTKTQVAAGAAFSEESGEDDPGELVMSDVLSMEQQAPWLRPGEPRVVPRVLDGEHAVWFRLAAIVGIAFGFLAAVVLTVTAAMTISEALDGRATVPVDEKGFS